MICEIIHKCKTALRIFREYTYCYSNKKYPNSFISKYNSSISSRTKKTTVNRVIYLFWTGNNEMSDNRKLGISSLQEASGVPVIVITPYNLSDYLVPEDPLPDGFEGLSLNHKSDYLRSYFMHYYGGGYSDIKKNNNSWIPSFDKMDSSSAYICGYPEIGPEGVASPNDEKLNTDLHKYWRLLIGCGSFICRPNTKFTDEWYKETKKRVLEKSNEIKCHPASDPFGSNEDYPVPWLHLMGNVFHPLCLKYHRKIIHDDRLKPSFHNYR